ncbi:MAG: hypothetical protein ACFFED_09710 [Candidatus Thorarchaeota archaeon]
MSEGKSLTIDVPSPSQKRQVQLDLLDVGFRVSWSTGGRPFQQAFRVDLQMGWITRIPTKDAETKEKRRDDVGIPIWLYRYILGHDLEDLQKAIRKQGK